MEIVTVGDCVASRALHLHKLSKQMTVLKVLGFALHTWNKQHANREFFFLTSQTFPCEFVTTLGILLSYCKALCRGNIWWLWGVFSFLIYLFSLPFP